MKSFTNKDKVKVLHIASTSTGGVGHNLLLLARYMNKKAFDLSFAVPPDSHFYQDILKEKVKVYPVNLRRNPSNINNFLGAFQLISIIRKRRFDIVHTHTSVGGLLGRVIAKLNGCPCVLWTIHGWAFNYPIGGSLRRKGFFYIEKFLDKFTDHYIAVSENMKDVGIRSCITSADKITVIYHGVEIEYFSNEMNYSNKLDELTIKKNYKIVGTVARLEPQKGVDDFIRAARMVKTNYPKVKFLIIGDGPLREELETMASELGMHGDFIFAGWRNDVAKYIQTMDIFCITSRWEAFGIVILEAMAMGKPIVATAVGGIPEIIENGYNGYLVDAGNPEAIANAVCKIISSENEMVKIIRRNKEKIEKMFDVKIMIKKYEEFYEKMAT